MRDAGLVMLIGSSTRRWSMTMALEMTGSIGWDAVLTGAVTLLCIGLVACLR